VCAYFHLSTRTVVRCCYLRWRRCYSRP